ncbi:MAG: hypothetical protein ABJ205_10770 [Erythrobacter sp.]|uniref:hypothetical protein n=1 Tax=Erythrobacter sp. TaxID=1042 RepID=UPI0032675139
MESYVTKKQGEKRLEFLHKALKQHGKAEVIGVNGLKSYPAAMRKLGNLDRREMGGWKQNSLEFYG